MEKSEEYKVEGEAPEQEEAVAHCPVCGQVREPIEREEGQMPPSVLIIRFAGPGSAECLVLTDGVVSRGQLGAATVRLFQEWAIPLMQMVAENTIASFMEELTKPRIQPARGPMPPGPGFYMPPRGGDPL